MSEFCVSCGILYVHASLSLFCLQLSVCKSVKTAASVWDQTPATVRPAGKVCSVRHVSLKQQSDPDLQLRVSTGVFTVMVSIPSSAVCKQRCLNGGRCVLPDYCHCRKGYQGLTCAIKVNTGVTLHLMTPGLEVISSLGLCSFLLELCIRFFER